MRRSKNKLNKFEAGNIYTREKLPPSSFKSIKIKENHPVTKLNISDDDVIFTMPAPVDVRMMSYGDRVSGGDR